MSRNLFPFQAWAPFGSDWCTFAESRCPDRLKTLRRALRQGRDLTPWVYPNSVGKPIDALKRVHRVWHPLLEKAGLRRVRFHDLRHTFASLLITHGESLAYVKEQLGHSSIQITVDLYGHLVPGANRNAVDRLAEATGRNLAATGEEARGGDREVTFR